MVALLTVGNRVEGDVVDGSRSVGEGDDVGLTDPDGELDGSFDGTPEGTEDKVGVNEPEGENETVGSG